MRYEKHILVLNGLAGYSGLKGTAAVEKTMMGARCGITVYNLDDAASGEYVLGFSAGDAPVEVKRLGRKGRISQIFELPANTDLSGRMYCVLAHLKEGAAVPLAFASNDNKKPWQSNMLDGIVKPPAFMDAPRPAREPEPEAGHRDYGRLEYPEHNGRHEHSERHEEYGRHEHSERHEERAPHERAGRNEPRTPYNKYINLEPPKYSGREGAGDGREPAGGAPENPFTQKPRSNQERFFQEEVNRRGRISSGNAGDMFLDILPPGGEYEDSAVAAENYFAPGYKGGADYAGGAVYGRDRYAGSEAAAAYEAAAEPERGAPENPRRYYSGRTDEADYSQGRNGNQSQNRSGAPYKASSLSGGGAEERRFAEPPPSPKSYERGQEAGNHSFYNGIREQIDDLFAKFPAAQDMARLLPGTRWVKVDYDGEGRFYIVGLIGEKPDYICYGVPAKYTPAPPKELEGYSQWFPLDHKNHKGDGYWLMYQDAATGDNVEVEII